jgi:hypothetical protein
MGRISILLIIAFVVFTATAARAQDGREIVLQAAKALEVTPTGKETRKTVKKAIEWILDTDTINVSLCRGAYGMIGDPDYKYAEEMISAYTIGVAAFQLENPSKLKDRNAVHLAGIALTLKVYEGYKKENPKSTSALINVLIEERDKDNLPQAVAALNCGNNK